MQIVSSTSRRQNQSTNRLVATLHSQLSVATPTCCPCWRPVPMPVESNTIICCMSSDYRSTWINIRFNCTNHLDLIVSVCMSARGRGRERVHVCVCPPWAYHSIRLQSVLLWAVGKCRWSCRRLPKANGCWPRNQQQQQQETHKIGQFCGRGARLHCMRQQFVACNANPHTHTEIESACIWERYMCVIVLNVNMAI